MNMAGKVVPLRVVKVTHSDTRQMKSLSKKYSANCSVQFLILSEEGTARVPRSGSR